MEVFKKESSKISLSFIVLIVFLTSYIGVFFIGMSMGSNGDAHCPFMQGSSMCSMTPLDHDAAILNMFTALPQSNTLLLLLILTLSLLAIPSFLRLFFPPQLKLKPIVYNTYSPPRSYLQNAFSSGILNSKTF